VSVAAVVTYKNDQDPDYLPVATEEEFYRDWLPLTGGLPLVELFGTGVSIVPEEFDELLNELAEFEANVPASLPVPPERQKILDRVHLLRRLVTRLNPDDIDNLYIG
jgi:hypothetical protein